MGKLQNLRRINWIIYVLVFFLCSFKFEDALASPLARSFVTILRNLVQIELVCGWVYSVRYRIINKRLRILLLTLTWLLIGLLLLRVVKYYFIFEQGFLHRLTWYAYYIPLTMMPACAVLCIDYLWKPDAYVAPKSHYCLFLPSIFFSLAVITNDFHHLFFSFPQGIAQYNTIYTYRPLYYLACIWIGILVLYFLIKVNRTKYTRFSLDHAAPFLIFAVMVLYCIAYLNQIFQGDFIAYNSLFIILILEFEIQSGGLPSNLNYATIFEENLTSVWIMDPNFQVYYKSKEAVDVPVEAFPRAVNQPVEIDHYELRCHPLTSGYVFWLADVSKQKNMIHDLKKIEERLMEGNDLKRAELKLQEDSIRVEEQSRLYEELEETVLPQLKKIHHYVEVGKKDPQLQSDVLKRICVLGAYVKRRCNLMILANNQLLVPIEELTLCMNESLKNINLLDIETACQYQVQGVMLTSHAYVLYELFEQVIETYMEQITSLQIDLFQKGSNVILQMHLNTRADIRDLKLESMYAIRGNCSCRRMEEGTIVKISVPIGGRI